MKKNGRIENIISFGKDIYKMALKVYENVKEYIINGNGVKLRRGNFI